MPTQRATRAGDGQGALETGFARRHIGPGADDQAAMLRLLGAASLDEFIDRAVPPGIRRSTPMRLPPALSEQGALAAMEAIGARNQVLRSFIGQGYHGTHTPSVILRNLLENPGWYTAYTPYQPEISQGRLEALLGFQTMVSDLTGMDIANASMLDEPTAAAEAMALAMRVTRSKSLRFFVAADCHPQTIAVVRTRAQAAGFEVVVGDAERELDACDVAGALLQYPSTDGGVRDPRALIERARARGVIVVLACDLLALCLLTPPGEIGADIAVGSAQRFGVPLGYGGPHAGFLATRDAYKRSMPGRLVGVTIDAEGAPAYRLALQTREQHIRREKATSNICTAQVLLAVISAMYAVYHGPEGLRRIARRVHAQAATLAAGIEQCGWTLKAGHFFDTLAIDTGSRTDEIIVAALARGINLRRIDAATTGIALDETAETADIEALLAVFAGGKAVPALPALESLARERLPEGLQRSSDFLTHPMFHACRSETEMMRYLRRLMDRDIALDRAMIPLGSCTMKLNAATEMRPVTWKAFGEMHPFAPRDQAEGYAQMIRDIEDWLCAITGYDAVSVQPNAGSQGEFAGLLAIRAWHEARGQGGRKVCLVPASAHGTNPASAQMAGMRVVVVACDSQGNVDIEDLERQARAHAEDLAVMMVTYPSTHGVFEARIREACEIVHRHGGQVYLDGANLNALVGVSSLAEIGADVSHFNLHKTFAIPHGGGGPGVGPIGVRAHLAPYLPDASGGLHPDAVVGPVSGAPYGSAGVLPITWSYIAMMGAEGLAAATRVAILNANYIAKRLAPHYPVLYTGPDGLVAHECIIDLRPLKETSGVGAEDVCKRLMDFGFHAPTNSFPVPGTLMIEPTESESKAELDRFCEAMIAIRAEIRAIEEGRWTKEDNPLVHAPHTAKVLLAAQWDHPYSREQAAFPLPWVREAKYWPPVGRIDQVYGDRNLVCTCPPVADYAQAA